MKNPKHFPLGMFLQLQNQVQFVCASSGEALPRATPWRRFAQATVVLGLHGQPCGPGLLLEAAV